MVYRVCLLALLLCGAAAGFGQSKKVPTHAPPAYLQPYTLSAKQGPATWQALVGKAAQAQVVFFGELHNDPISHWLELALLDSLARRHGKNLALGLEMLEADDQNIVDEYLTSIATVTHLEAAANLWPNYKTDYAPLVDVCKAEGLSVVASNVPRRYASLVARRGLPALDSLSAQAKTYLCPLPLTVPYSQPTYKEMAAMGGHAEETGQSTFVAAQALKDATMAYRIAQALAAKPGATLLHVNGAYHSKQKEGILTYLERYRPGTRTLTIQVIGADDEPDDKADYTIKLAEGWLGE